MTTVKILGLFPVFQLPFDPNMKKKKKKKKTGFDPDALDGGDAGDATAKSEEPAADTAETTEQTQEKSADEGCYLSHTEIKKKIILACA